MMQPALPQHVSVAVVMLTFNQRESTIRALESIDPTERATIEIVLWDNASTDGTVEAVRARFPDVHCHWSERNLGVASGRNAAAALALDLFQPKYLLFLDNDLVLTRGFVPALVDAFAVEARLGQAQAKLRSLLAPERINDGGGCEISFWRGRTRPVGFDEVDRGQFDRPAPCVSCGGAMMVRADLFRQLGGFDTVFDPFGPEDLDFSLRLQSAGFKAMYIPRAMAYHQVSHTFEGGGGYSATYARVKAQHWLRFLNRHGSWFQKVAFALIGAPLIIGRMAFRELRKGNPGALLGSARGVVAGMRRTHATSGRPPSPRQRSEIAPPS
jgi:GT2 family glycosyltransferase